MACFLNLPAPIYKRKDVVSKRKTKTYLPPPQRGSIENNPMLLLILNSFVSKTTHWRPYLWVRVFVHLRKNTCISVRKNEGRWLLFLVSLVLFWPCIISFIFLLHPTVTLCLPLDVHNLYRRDKLEVDGICGNQTLMQFC